METFEQWVERTGRHGYGDNANSLAKDAWEAATAQSRNYTADDVEMPESVTFSNGRVVRIVDNKTPGVHLGVYLQIE